MKGNSPLFGNRPKRDEAQQIKSSSMPSTETPFVKNGQVTLKSVSDHREFFLGKTVDELQNELSKYGYQTISKGSNHKGSKAELIVVSNSSSERNITQIQISSGSKRHGSVPYVKISTSDYGRIKIIGSEPDDYKTDGTEKAHLLFRRK